MRRPGSPRRPIVVGVLLIAACVALLVFDRAGGGPGPVGRLVGRVLSPLQSLVTGAARAVREVREDYSALGEVRDQNRTLHEEIATLKGKVAALEGLAVENERLRSLLELGDERKDLRLRAARVSARGVSPYFRVLRVTLDADGPDIQPGMPVIAPGGLVGQIRTVSGDGAEVLLVTDPRSAVDVVLETSRVRGLAVGTGEPDRYAARLEYLQRSDETAAGERVLTTGDDGRYPRGLVLGRVTSVKPQAHGLFQDAELEPLVDLSALEEVFIVLGPSGLTPDGKEMERAPKPGEAPSSGGRANP